MIITLAGFKGGVSKTTSAIHIAALLQRHAPTLLIDGDPNRSATGWSRRGNLPFKVIDERQAARHVKDYEHVVIDTQARPAREDMEALIDGCDLLILPSTPDALALDALMQTVEELRTLNAERFRILLTIVPPKPSRDGDEARAMLIEAGLPVFTNSIRRLAAFQKAALAGVPVSEVSDPRAAAAWAEFEALEKELI